MLNLARDWCRSKQVDDQIISLQPLSCLLLQRTIRQAVERADDQFCATPIRLRIQRSKSASMFLASAGEAIRDATLVGSRRDEPIRKERRQIVLKTLAA